MIALLLRPLPRLLRRAVTPAPCPREQAWQAWADEYDRAPGSPLEQDLWRTLNLESVRRAA